MAKRKHAGESPLPALQKDLTVSKQQLVEVLAAARARVYAEIQRRAKDPAFARDGTTRERVLAGIGDHYDKMAEDLDQWSTELAARVGGNFYGRAKRDTGTANDKVKFDRAYAERYMRLVHEKNAPSLAAVHAQKMKQEDVAALRSVVIQTLNQAAVTGATGREIQRDMQAGVEKLATEGLPSWQFLDKDGRAWTNGNYFNMLTRTITSTVARAGYVDGMVEDGFDLATIEGGGDPCPVCANWRGVVVSVSGANKDFPSLQDATDDGVFHPNCACEPRYIDEQVGKDVIEAQRDLPLPEAPEDGDPAWDEYTKQIREDGKLREDFVEVDEVPEAMDVPTKAEDAALAAEAEDSREEP